MNEFYPILFTISGTLIVILLSVIGFFIARLINDVRNNVEEIGKNKGRIELVEQKQQSDIKRIEQITQLEIKALAEKVGDLSENVNTLVTHFTNKS